MGAYLDVAHPEHWQAPRSSCRTIRGERARHPWHDSQSISAADQITGHRIEFVGEDAAPRSGKPVVA